jgi:hypothetical protein
LISNTINDLSREWNLTQIFPVTSEGKLPVFRLSTELEFQIPVFDISGKNKKENAGKTPTTWSNTLGITKQSATLKIYIDINDVGLISSVSFGSVKPVQTIDFEKAQIEAANQNTIDHTVIEPHIPDEATKTQQVESALKNQSNLELVLRAIEMYSLSKNILQNNNSIDNPQMSVFELTNKDNLPFLEKIFSNGIYREFLLH